MTPGAGLLEIGRVTKTFGGVKALTDISFNVCKGETVGLIGPNGSGKTTMFNVITGLLRPTSGHVRLEGKRIESLAPHVISRLGVSRSFQNIRLFNNMSVRENVFAGMRMKTLGIRLADIAMVGATRSDREGLLRRCDELLDFFGLGGLGDERADSLPYGHKRRLEFARALATEPKLLLLDEPTAGMNPQETTDIIGCIKKMAQQGMTMVVIEHDMKVIMGTCQRIVVLSYGEKIAEGSPGEIRRNPAVVEAYLGKDLGDA